MAGVAWVFLQSAREAWAATSAPGPASASDAIVLVAALVGLVLTLWLGLGLVLALLAWLPGIAGRAAERLASRLAPVAVRRMVAFLLGTSLTAALAPGTAAAGPPWTGAGSSGSPRPLAAAPQHASLAVPDPSFDALLGPAAAQHAVPIAGVTGGVPAGAGPTGGGAGAVGAGAGARADGAGAGAAGAGAAAPVAGGSPAATPSPAAVATTALTLAPDPAWTPLPPKRVRRMADPSVDLVSRPPARSRVGDEMVVVRRGDTLWDIAARHLGPSASIEDVAQEWPRWHAANARVIGSDPDLILPGQRLRPPSAERVTR